MADPPRRSRSTAVAVASGCEVAAMAPVDRAMERLGVSNVLIGV
jgi:hypothetical protein